MAAHLIEKLLAYGVTYLFLKEEDIIYVRNSLLFKLKVDAPDEKGLDFPSIKNLDVPDTLISELEVYIKKHLHLENFECEQLIEDIMADLTPLPSTINQMFWDKYKTSKEDAVKFLYNLNVKANYVQKTKIAQNIKWVSKDGLEVSINLSRPEKDNKEIQKEAKIKSFNYPKCVICLENVGYFGRPNHSIRRTIRVVDLKLNDENWFLQYSPFGYYDEHLIVITNEHKPMEVNRKNTEALFAFLDLFPFYFIGANSDLPITGGSILSHEHFQGGRYTFPLMKAKDVFSLSLKGYEEIKTTYLDFYNSSFKLSSSNKVKLIDLAMKINEAWLSFNDLEGEIISATNGQRHSSLTMIGRKQKDVYELFIILRNNRTNETHPDGIFHAHKKYHHIKREGIGLIEAMGLFILPPRLKRQSLLIEKIIEEDLKKEQYLKLDPELVLFETMINDLRESKENLSLRIKENISDVCKNILLNTSVFKKDENGHKVLERFIKHLEKTL
ncbi:MAG: galactose-1-phosphate uridylyltransferase [Bacilli bacterium]|jgi:UDPglucose--hexose-1-phosphate uridylyltransferase|nr:galactose-1-phosphate uridylyltransferase [Bacilli bacterium]NLN80139.1 galactose-1-phosphate uridylyltransferase [Erysipelotrichia bacterium]